MLLRFPVLEQHEHLAGDGQAQLARLGSLQLGWDGRTTAGWEGVKRIQGNMEKTDTFMDTKPGHERIEKEGRKGKNRKCRMLWNKHVINVP